MNERELARTLQETAFALGLDERAVARRLDESESTVAPAFTGGGGFTVELLVNVAAALGLELDLRAAAPTPRRTSAVPTVVDQAILKVTPELFDQGGSESLDNTKKNANPHGVEK